MTATTGPRPRLRFNDGVWTPRAGWQAVTLQWRVVQAHQAAHAARNRAMRTRLRRHMPQANGWTLDITAAILTARGLLGPHPRPAPHAPLRPAVVCARAAALCAQAQALCRDAERLQKARPQGHGLDEGVGARGAAAD